MLDEEIIDFDDVLGFGLLEFLEIGAELDVGVFHGFEGYRGVGLFDGGLVEEVVGGGV